MSTLQAAMLLPSRRNEKPSKQRSRPTGTTSTSESSLQGRVTLAHLSKQRRFEEVSDSLQIEAILTDSLLHRRIPKNPCYHKQHVVAKDVIIQLPLRNGCLRSGSDDTINQRVSRVEYCANSCCERVFAMEKA